MTVEDGAIEAVPLDDAHGKDDALVPDPKPKKKTSSPKTPHRIVRAGTWYLVPPVGKDDENRAVISTVVDALKSDTRVLEVTAPDLNDYWTYRRSIYPPRGATTANGVLTGSDAIEFLEISAPIYFKVRVPIKNQEPHQGHDDVPSDTYWVTWNGVGIAVMWEQDDYFLPISGGHVVEQVLREVLETVDCALFVQGCSPNCEFLFLHPSIRPRLVRADEDVEGIALRSADDRRSVVLISDHLPRGADEMLVYLALVILPALSDLADMKNVGRRIIDLENEIRFTASRVLALYHEHALLASEKARPGALKKRWQSRSWRKEAWSNISGIWLGVTNIEILRRAWNTEVEALSFHEDLALLMTQDTDHDIAAVNALNLQPLVETVNQVTAALNNRSMTAATALGALAGGVAGGATGLLG